MGKAHIQNCSSSYKTFEQLADDISFGPEYVVLETSDGKILRGIIIEERVDKTKDTLDRYIYDIRHADEDDSILTTLEESVDINWAFSIALDSPVDFNSAIDKQIVIKKYSYEDWEEAAYYFLMDEFENTPEVHSEFGEFITDHWQNLDTAKGNLENFRNWLKAENIIVLP